MDRLAGCRRLCRRRCRALFRPARAALFALADADLAGRGRPAGGRRGRAHHRRRRAGDRVARAATPRSAGRDLFPRQRRDHRQAGSPASGPDCRRRRSRRAVLPRLYGLDRTTDRGRAVARRRGRLPIRRVPLSFGPHCPVGSLARVGRCGGARRDAAGRQARPGGALLVDRRRRRIDVSVRAGAEADARPVPFGPAHRRCQGLDPDPARRQGSRGPGCAGRASVRARPRAQALRALSGRRARRSRRLWRRRGGPPLHRRAAR